MANKDDYLTYYREFFENFAQTVNPNDQLPVKLSSYKLVNVEVVGGIIDWTTQYLTQKKCPVELLAPLIKIVIEEIRKECKKQPVKCGFNQGDNAYEPLKLMQTVMAKTNEVCLRYLDNSKLCSLPPPGPPYSITSVHAVRNTRRRMEDRHVVIHDLNTMFCKQEATPSSYYAIFDGHAGHDAAAYSAAHLHQFLAESVYFLSDPDRALLEAFCKTDALFLNKCKVENVSSGTTAVCALLRPKEKYLYIAWVGDSQALLVKQGQILQCVNPHKPSRTDERERIERGGGCVMLWGTWRVNGQLAVSRAIGDPDYKPHVIAIPEIKEIALDGNEDFLIIACDGLWDFLSEDSAANAVYFLLAEKPDDTERISQHLVQLAKSEGSTDNISVIVVFLRDPLKIAAEAPYWANRNGSTVRMDATLDNANNPFSNSNGASGDNILTQKADDLLLNITDNFKSNGTTEFSPTDEFYLKEKPNGKRLASEFEDDEDLGPETDVDAVDDVLLSPAKASAKAIVEGIVNNNMENTGFNPFFEHQHPEKALLEIDEDIEKQQSDLDEDRIQREETPTPPVDAVHNVSGLLDNAGESDSEDEWNYFKGDDANKENLDPTQPEQEVANIIGEEDNMSQLNPNAAEFVPESPTRSIPSPACRALINDQVLSQSPLRPTNNELDINLPNPQEFEKEVKSRPSDVEFFTNGHNSDSEPNENLLLNGKNIDEIPEFQPSPIKTPATDEFHFGPNATPFTPAKLLDQSEAALSTQAQFGDESTLTLNDSILSQDYIMNKESDPMSMSFYQDKDNVSPFDLNQVQILPDNLDEFLHKTDEPEKVSTPNPVVDEIATTDESQEKLFEDGVITTDLDKPGYDEKELESPISNEKDLISNEAHEVNELELFAKSPVPSNISGTEELPVTDDDEADHPSPVCEALSPKSPDLPDFCEDSTPKSVADTESVATNDVNSFLDRSDVPEVTSPINSVEVTAVDDTLNALNEEGVPEALMTCVYPLPTSTNDTLIDVKFENIEHEVAEETIISPSEESKHSDEVTTAPLTEDNVEDSFVLNKEEDISTLIPSATPDVLEGEFVKEAVTPVDEISFEKEEIPKVENILLQKEPDLIPNLEIDQLLTTEKMDEPEEVPQKAPVLEGPDVISALNTELLDNVLQPQQGDNIPAECNLKVEKEEVQNISCEKNVDDLPTEKIITQAEFEEINDAFVEIKNEMAQVMGTIKDTVESVKMINEIKETILEPKEINQSISVMQETDTEVKEIVPEPAIIPKSAEKKPSSTKPNAPKSSSASSVQKKPATLASKTAKPPILGKSASANVPAKTTSRTGTISTTRSAITSKPSVAKSPATKPSSATSMKSPPKPKTATTTTNQKTSTTTVSKTLTNGTTTKLTVQKASSAPAKPSNRTLSSTAKPASKSATTTTKPIPPPSTRSVTNTARSTTTKPRPTTLTSKPTTTVDGTVKPTTKATTTTTRTNLSPKVPAIKRIPPTSTNTKPLSATKVGSKVAPDTEKQIKESANKLTASRTTTRPTQGLSKVTNSTAMKKIEAKTTSTRPTLTKTSTTTTKTTTTTTKKSNDPSSNKVITKTTKTKIEKPKTNGVTTVVTQQEELIVNNVVTAIETTTIKTNDCDPQEMIKDNSPVNDNKQFVDNLLIENTMVD